MANIELKKLTQRLFAIRFVISSAPIAELAYEPAPSDSAIAITPPERYILTLSWHSKSFFSCNLP